MENTITRLQLKVMCVHGVCSSVYVITIALIKIQPLQKTGGLGRVLKNAAQNCL